MKGKLLILVVLVMAGLVALGSRQDAQASHGAGSAMENVYASLSAGEVDAALASFAEGASAENRVRAESYRGLSEIRTMLAGMQRAGRRFEIVAAEVSGDTIRADVEVSDRGVVWGTQVVSGVLDGEHLKDFSVDAFRLELWRIGR